MRRTSSNSDDGVVKNSRSLAAAATLGVLALATTGALALRSSLSPATVMAAPAEPPPPSMSLEAAIEALKLMHAARGVTGSQAWSVQTEQTLAVGEAVELAGYRVRFDGLSQRDLPNHVELVGAFTVSNGRTRAAVMRPVKKFYPQGQAPIAGVDYRMGLRDDLYLVLGDFAPDGAHATVKVLVNRLVTWIWIGGGILTLGAARAVLPERRKSS